MLNEVDLDVCHGGIRLYINKVHPKIVPKYMTIMGPMFCAFNWFEGARYTDDLKLSTADELMAKLSRGEKVSVNYDYREHRQGFLSTEEYDTILKVLDQLEALQADYMPTMKIALIPNLSID